MDSNGVLYVVNENGGGDIDHPELWVYAPSSVPNQAPTGLSLANQLTSIAENTIISPRRKVADVVVTDDGLGINNLTVFGADAASFEVDLNGLYLKAGTNLDFEIKSTYTVTVAVDDPNVGGEPRRDRDVHPDRDRPDRGTADPAVGGHHRGRAVGQRQQRRTRSTGSS